MPATQTAVIVPVAAAEQLVSAYRRRLDRAAAWGVPAHVTIVYPFADPAGVTDDVIARLTAAVAEEPAFDCAFTECRWFGDDVLWLAPDRPEPFRRLTEAVVAAFPEQRPYGGAFDEVVPHLTVGERRWGTTADLRAAEAEIAERLPVTARIEHALLIAGEDAPDGWHTVAELPLGAA